MPILRFFRPGHPTPTLPHEIAVKIFLLSQLFSMKIWASFTSSFSRYLKSYDFKDLKWQFKMPGLNFRPLFIARTTNFEEENTYLISTLFQTQMINGNIKRLNLHNDWVMRVAYLPELRCVVSCSTDENTALALTQPECFKYQSAFSSLSGN